MKHKINLITYMKVNITLFKYAYNGPDHSLHCNLIKNTLMEIISRNL